jgi:cell division protease FtsH
MRTYQTDPHGRAPAVTWRQWLLPLGAAAGIVALVALSGGAASSMTGYLADTLAVRLGGRAAELLIRGEASTGAADDLASATALATQMVREFGLSQAIGPVSYAGAQTWSFAAPGTPRGYSERTQWRIDREVAALLTRAEARARELLTEHRQALHQLTTALAERETITGDQVRALVRAASPPSASADRPDLR